MRVLVVGAAGFVGGYLIPQLKSDGHEIAATKLPNEKMHFDGVKQFDMNILKPEEISAVLDEFKPEGIIHLAAQSSVALSWKNPALTIDINVKGTVNLLEAVRCSGRPIRVVLIGSGEEYGYVHPDESPVSEENVLRPGNIYAATKACQNMLGSIYSKAYGMDIIMVRAFNHIGPGQAPVFVAADFCKQTAEIESGMRKPIINVGNLEAMRDFSDVRDVVRAYSMLLSKGIAGETYNVGSGNAVKISAMLDMIISLSKVSITVNIEQQRLRPSDIPVIEADTKKLCEHTGWRPTIPLKKTLSDTMNYWRVTLGNQKEVL